MEQGEYNGFWELHPPCGVYDNNLNLDVVKSNNFSFPARPA
jgi:hypothetical protein